MFARIFSCAVIGIDAAIVEVEVDFTNGLPGMTIVGLPDLAVQESRERVQTAIKNAGLTFPRHRIVVNLAPASVRKEGSYFDLPIALGVMLLSGAISIESLADTLVIGELSLDGSVRHARGVLPMAATARTLGYKNLICPQCDAAEASLIPDIRVIPVSDLKTLYEHLTGQDLIKGYVPPVLTHDEENEFTDFSEVRGQEQVKRALEVTAAGGHNILMTGCPGSGKTLLARALPGILPDLTLDESLDVTRIYSVADLLPAGSPLIKKRPFRAPHHTISHAGLVGGGHIPHPGEISLAHRGVLFLDEFPEFGARVLEVMRQPMEDKVVTISRANGTLTFSANFQLVAAMNPCPCGYWGDLNKNCTCSMTNIMKYQKRISGPILDRIDIHISVPRVEYSKLASDRTGESSGLIKNRVETARQIQRDRFEDKKVFSNSDMRLAEIRKHCVISPEGDKLLKHAIDQMNLTARGYHRVLKISRTIADLDSSEMILPNHIAEALQYRPKNIGI